MRRESYDRIFLDDEERLVAQDNLSLNRTGFDRNLMLALGLWFMFAFLGPHVSRAPHGWIAQPEPWRYVPSVLATVCVLSYFLYIKWTSRSPVRLPRNAWLFSTKRVYRLRNHKVVEIYSFDDVAYAKCLPSGNDGRYVITLKLESLRRHCRENAVFVVEREQLQTMRSLCTKLDSAVNSQRSGPLLTR